MYFTNHKYDQAIMYNNEGQQILTDITLEISFL